MLGIVLYAYALSRTHRRAAQYGTLPLHFAAAGKGSDAVVGALLEASPGAAKTKDGVRTPHPHNLLSCVGCTPSVCMRALTARRRAAQSWKRLPLHFAAAGKASEVVLTALLAAYPGAAKDKVRLPSPRPHNVPSELGRTAYVHTRSHSLAAALHRVGGCFRCTLLRQ